jgi:tetratricopeptide (TPR) repeat protein
MPSFIIPHSSFIILFLCASAFSQSAGLDSLSDDRLLADLAVRGQTTLLERAFVTDKTPPDIQESLRAIAQLRAPDPKRTLRQRQDLARKAAIGAARSANLLGDPQTLIDLASILLTDAAARDVNTLEYWGENTATQASLRPIADAVIALLDKAATIASTKADAIANTLKSPDDPAAAQYEKLASAAQNAQYTARMADYVLALATDAADPRRAQVATRAIDYLTKFDNADSQVQPIVRNRLAKLHLLRRDFDDAVKLFDSVAQGNAIQPGPTVYQQYEARYFAAVAELLAGRIDSAQTRLNDLLTWQRTNLPPGKEAQEGAAAAASMLQYRIYATKNDNDKAVTVLMELVKSRPDLSGIIFDQVVTRLPEDADLTKLDPLLLEGIIRRADQERL